MGSTFWYTVSVMHTLPLETEADMGTDKALMSLFWLLARLSRPRCGTFQNPTKFFFLIFL